MATSLHLSPSDGELVGRTVLISGGSRGIGAAMAEHFAARGATVGVLSRTAIPTGTSVVAFEADLQDPAAVSAAARAATETLGAIDTLIHCAGAATVSDDGVLAMGEDDWAIALETNLLGAVRLDRALVPAMVECGRGCVVHLSSIQRRFALQSSVPYATSKAALTAYSKALATTVGPFGVRVNSIAPGIVETEMSTAFAGALAEAAGVGLEEGKTELMNLFGGVPYGQIARPEEIAELVAFLVSDRAPSMLGGEYVIDGGTLQSL